MTREQYGIKDNAHHEEGRPGPIYHALSLSRNLERLYHSDRQVLVSVLFRLIRKSMQGVVTKAAW